MTKQKLVSGKSVLAVRKIEVKTLLSSDQIKDLNPRKLFTVAVCDEQQSYQGYRLLTDQIPSNWNLHKINGSLSLFPIVTGG